jgi:hypothetical protein
LFGTILHLSSCGGPKVPARERAKKKSAWQLLCGTQQVRAPKLRGTQQVRASKLRGNKQVRAWQLLIGNQQVRAPSRRPSYSFSLGTKAAS